MSVVVGGAQSTFSVERYNFRKLSVAKRGGGHNAIDSLAVAKGCPGKGSWFMMIVHEQKTT